jgi:hypothetical protein
MRWEILRIFRRSKSGRAAKVEDRETKVRARAPAEIRKESFLLFISSPLTLHVTSPSLS